MNLKKRINFFLMILNLFIIFLHFFPSIFFLSILFLIHFLSNFPRTKQNLLFFLYFFFFVFSFKIFGSKHSLRVLLRHSKKTLMLCLVPINFDRKCK